MMYTINPGFKYERSRDSDCLFYMYGHFELRMTWPCGLVVGVSGYKIRGPGVIPVCAPILCCCGCFFFFSILMLNYFILVKWHHQKGPKLKFLNFLY